MTTCGTPSAAAGPPAPGRLAGRDESGPEPLAGLDERVDLGRPGRRGRVGDDAGRRAGIDRRAVGRAADRRGRGRLRAAADGEGEQGEEGEAVHGVWSSGETRCREECIWSRGSGPVRPGRRTRPAARPKRPASTRPGLRSGSSWGLRVGGAPPSVAGRGVACNQVETSTPPATAPGPGAACGTDGTERTHPSHTPLFLGTHSG